MAPPLHSPTDVTALARIEGQLAALYEAIDHLAHSSLVDSAGNRRYAYLRTDLVRALIATGLAADRPEDEFRAVAEGVLGTKGRLPDAGAEVRR